MTDIATVKTRLSMLPYTELRKQAKENDIKANLKKDQLIENLARKLVGNIDHVSLKKDKRKGPRRYTVAIGNVQSADSSGAEGDDKHNDENESSVGRKNEESELQVEKMVEDMETEESASGDMGKEEILSDAPASFNVVRTNPSQEPPRRSRRSRHSAELNETFDGDSDGEEKLKELPTSSGRDSNEARRQKILAEINERAAARLACGENNEPMSSPARDRNAPLHKQTVSGGTKKTPVDGNRFKNAHAKLFNGMQSIEDHINKKQQRHIALTSGASQHLRALATPKSKARNRMEMARKLPTTFTKKSPNRKQLPKKPITAPGFKFDTPGTPSKLDFNFGGKATPSHIQSVQKKKPGRAQNPVKEAVLKSTTVAVSSPARPVRNRQQPARAMKQLNTELPPTTKAKKAPNADIPKPSINDKQITKEPPVVRGGLSSQRYTPYKGRIPKFVDTTKMSDAQIDQLKRMGGLKNVHATQTTARIATATTAVKRSVQQKQAQGRSRLIDSKRQIKP